MRIHWHYGPTAGCIRFFTFALASLILNAGVSFCQDPETVTKVEEDWVALIRSPDSGNTTPQIVNVISPGGAHSDLTGIVELNHSSQPTFQAGGYQIQAWNGISLQAAERGSEYRSLYQSMDRIEYTITMEKTEEGLSFGIVNGKSKSWGRFAHRGDHASLTAPDVTLEQYRPEDSVASTNVNVGAHRVEILYLKAVRRHFSNGDVETDDTMRVIHRFQELVQVVSLSDYDRNADFYNIEIDE
jgi:hypothetical protein